MDKQVTLNHIAEYTSHSTGSESNLSSLKAWFGNGWTYLVHHFIKGHEPRVWQKCTAAGDVFYGAYDPYSGRSTYLTSDIDLRIWLEQLPYQ